MYNNSKLHSICIYRTCIDFIQNLHILSSPTAQQNRLLATITRRPCTQFRTISNRRFQCYCRRFRQDHIRTYRIRAKHSGKKLQHRLSFNHIDFRTMKFQQMVMRTNKTTVFKIYLLKFKVSKKNLLNLKLN